MSNLNNSVELSKPVMRSASYDCGLVMKVNGVLGGVTAAIVSMPIVHTYYRDRVTAKRVMTGIVIGAVGGFLVSQVMSFLFEPACEPQNRASSRRRAGFP